MASHRNILQASLKSCTSLFLFYFKIMSADYVPLAAMLKPLRTRRKPPNPNKIIFSSDEKNFKQDGKTNSQNDR